MDTVNGTCTLCPAGKYSSKDGVTSCTRCPAGKYSTAPTSQANNTACTNCLPGYFANDTSSTTCAACEAGTYIADAGQSYCTTCRAGTYSSSAKASLPCTTCLAGTYSVADKSTSCTPCAAGYFANLSNSTACSLCLAGTVAPAGSSRCTLCPWGTYSSTNGMEKCISCPSGKYSATAGSTECTDCFIGYFAQNNGSSSCAACLPGKYIDKFGASSCKNCPAGKRSVLDLGSIYCVDCDPGTFAATEGNDLCSACSGACVEGQRYESTACNASTNRVCSACRKQQCSTGTTSNVTWCPSNKNGYFDCIPCPSYGNDNVHLVPEYSCSSCPARDCGGTPGTYRIAKCPTSYQLNDTYSCGRCQGCTYRFYVKSWGSVCNGYGDAPASLDTSNTSQCLPCVTYCQAGQYISNLCNGRSQNNTETCTNCTSCPYGHYHAKNLTGKMHPDYEWKPWSSGYVELPCTGRGILNSDGLSDCERCDACPNGMYAYDVKRCTGNGIWKDPFNCTECKPCKSGYEHSVPCNGLSFDDSCKLCPACPQHTYISSYWNATSKRMVCGCTRCLDLQNDTCSVHNFRTNVTCSGLETYDESCQVLCVCVCVMQLFTRAAERPSCDRPARCATRVNT